MVVRAGAFVNTSDAHRVIALWVISLERWTAQCTIIYMGVLGVTYSVDSAVSCVNVSHPKYVSWLLERSLHQSGVSTMPLISTTTTTTYSVVSESSPAKSLLLTMVMALLLRLSEITLKRPVRAPGPMTESWLPDRSLNEYAVHNVYMAIVI